MISIITEAPFTTYLGLLSNPDYWQTKWCRNNSIFQIFSLYGNFIYCRLFRTNTFTNRCFSVSIGKALALLFFHQVLFSVVLQ